MVEQDPFRIYLDAERKSRGFQRAGDFVFLAIVIVCSGGALLGLMPEWEKSLELDERIALEVQRVEAAKGLLREKQVRLQHLQNDVEYMEQELRNSSPRSAKPGETLILVPPDRRKIYQEQ